MTEPSSMVCIPPFCCLQPDMTKISMFVCLMPVLLASNLKDSACVPLLLPLTGRPWLEIETG